jgi:hypothetical protein
MLHRRHYLTQLAAASPCRMFGSPSKPAHRPVMPTKDRFPPRSYDASNPRRRLAVLVDASKLSAEAFVTDIEPAIMKYGYPILIRVFDHSMKSDWNTLVGGATNSITSLLDAPDSPIPQVRAGKSSTSLKRSVDNPACMEFFRVEKFIPISMQIGADANHLAEFKSLNMTQGIVYVCTKLERPMYEQYFERLRGTQMNQYSFDEGGFGSSVEEDGRSQSGD